MPSQLAAGGRAARRTGRLARRRDVRGQEPRIGGAIIEGEMSVSTKEER